MKIERSGCSDALLRCDNDLFIEGDQKHDEVITNHMNWERFLKYGWSKDAKRVGELFFIIIKI